MFYTPQANILQLTIWKIIITRFDDIAAICHFIYTF